MLVFAKLYPFSSLAKQENAQGLVPWPPLPRQPVSHLISEAIHDRRSERGEGGASFRRHSGATCRVSCTTIFSPEYELHLHAWSVYVVGQHNQLWETFRTSAWIAASVTNKPCLFVFGVLTGADESLTIRRTLDAAPTVVSSSQGETVSSVKLASTLTTTHRCWTSSSRCLPMYARCHRSALDGEWNK